MNPLGIAMAFVVLWAMIGLGVFLIATAAVRLTKKEAPMGAVATAMVAGETRVQAKTVVSVVLLLAGIVLTYVGGNGIYTVIYR